MSSPNRTTKPERRAARRHNPMMCAAIGISATARLRRRGAFTTDTDALDQLGDLFDASAGARVPAIEKQRLGLALAMDVPPAYITPRHTGWSLADLTDTEHAEAQHARDHLRGGGIVQYPGVLAVTTDCGAPDHLRQIIAPALAEGDPEAVPTLEATWCCIECGIETAPGQTVCSSSCGYALTGDYPPAYEKDYGDA